VPNFFKNKKKKLFHVTNHDDEVVAKVCTLKKKEKNVFPIRKFPTAAILRSELKK